MLLKQLEDELEVKLAPRISNSNDRVKLVNAPGEKKS